MKKTLSLVLAFCMICSIIAVVPAIQASAHATDPDGNALSKADFIIDVGHGGNDPGAMSTVLGGNRKESEDVLRLALATARLIIQSGSTVAMTRYTDETVSLTQRTDMANAGSYSYFVSIHRNACGTANLATGIETYYHNSQSSTSVSAKLATSVQNAAIGVGCWANRGVKTSNFHVTRESNMPAILIEYSFIDNASDNQKFDQYFNENAKAIANGMLAMIGKSVTDAKTVSAPSVTVASTSAHNQSINVSWGAVTNATSYNYTATVYEGEMSATTGKTIVSSSTTGTSFTIPAQASGKYVKVSVTAVGPNNKAETVKSVMLGKDAVYPTDVQYIPVADVNGSQSVSNSTVWNSSVGTAFGMTWWRAFVCSPNADGTYTVNSIYENGVAKSVSVTGTNVLWAIHSGYTGYDVAATIVVGDKLTFCGVYIDNKTVRGTGYVLVNGGVALHPDDLTLSDATVAVEDDFLVGVGIGDTGSEIVSKFNESADYVKVYDAAGAEVTGGVVCTGYTVNLVVNSEVVKSITIIISGDVNGDGAIGSSDILVVSGAVDGSSKLNDVFSKAGDIDGSGTVTSTDYMALCNKI